MPRVRILVAEDEIIKSREIQRSLVQSGYSVCGIAVSGEETLKLTNQHHPDLILMDILLQGHLNGIDTARRIYNTTKTPIVFLTGYADEMTIRRAKMSGALGYVLKPHSDHALKATIELALQSARRLHELETRLHVLTEEKRKLTQKLNALTNQSGKSQ